MIFKDKGFILFPNQLDFKHILKSITFMNFNVGFFWLKKLTDPWTYIYEPERQWIELHCTKIRNKNRCREV